MNQKLVTMAAAVIAMGCLSLTAYMAYATHSVTNPPARTIPYQGTLAENQQPVTGQETLIFTLYDDASCQTSFWDEQQTVDVVGGRFSTQLGTVDVFERHSANDPFAKPEIFLGIEIVGATALVGCQKITAAPRAVAADNGVPPGTIVPFGGTSADVPSGWLLCDGHELSSSEYAQLYAAIGTVWGDGTSDSDASSDFNVPDLRGQFLRGADDRTRASGAPDRSAPREPGESQPWATSLRSGVSISVNSNGAHTHTMGTGGADSGTMSPGGSTQRLSHFRNDQYNAGAAKRTDANGSHIHTLTISSAEETTPVNKAVNYIIKY